jgi:uncharacterized membrane protein
MFDGRGKFGLVTILGVAVIFGYLFRLNLQNMGGDLEI